jgi:predicted Zn-dependent protease
MRRSTGSTLASTTSKGSFCATTPSGSLDSKPPATEFGGVDTESPAPNAVRVAPRLGRAIVVASTAILISIAGTSSSFAGAPAAARPVAFVPLGEFPRSEADSLERHFERTLRIQARVLPGANLPASAYNTSRKQYLAEELIDVVAARRSTASAREVLIGLTTRDMHTRDIPNWRFSFSIRHPSGLAVVSRARMDPAVLGLAPDAALRTRRLRKMVLKNIGVLAFGLAESRNPRSALYDAILSTNDLDFMTEEFRPRAPTAARRSWLERADATCERGIVEAKALIARSPLTTQEQILAFARGSISLAERNRRQLAALRSAPEDRSAVRRLLARFAGSIRADRGFVAKLTARWSDATIQAWATKSVRNSLALTSSALELGSRECGRYFDPSTLRR